MPPDAPEPRTIAPADWADRQRRWARKLGRLRLGAEPLGIQLARCRRVTWVLTAVAATVALMFVALFAAFGRPGVGAVVAGVLLGPVAAIAWLDYAILSRRASAYERERRAQVAGRNGQA